MVAREGKVATFGLGTLVFLVPAASFLLQGSANTVEVSSDDGFLQFLLADLSSTTILVLLACCAPALGTVMKQSGAGFILWLHRIFFGKNIETTSTDAALNYASLAFADEDAARLYVLAVATTTGGLGLALLTGSLVTIIAALFPALDLRLWAIPVLAGLVGLLLSFIAVVLVRPALDRIRPASRVT